MYNFKKLLFGKPRMTGIDFSHYQVKGLTNSHERIVGFKFVVVGKNTNTGNGLILYSNDGLNWTKIEDVFGYPFNDVASDGLSFLTVGEYGKAYFSTDGSVWIPVITPFGNTNITRVISLGKDKWLLGGAQGKMALGSVKTKEWNLLDTSLSINDTVLGLWSIKNDIYVSTTDNSLMRTLITSQTVVGPYSKIDATIIPEKCLVKRGNNLYGISNNILITSEDGKNWTSTSKSAKTLTAGNNLFVIAYDKNVLLSQTFLDWNKVEIGFEAEYISYGNGTWIMIGDNMTKVATAFSAI